MINWILLKSAGDGDGGGSYEIKPLRHGWRDMHTYYISDRIF